MVPPEPETVGSPVDASDPKPALERGIRGKLWFAIHTNAPRRNSGNISNHISGDMALI